VCHHHRVDRGRERAAARGDGAKVREAAGVRVAHVHTAVEKNRKLPRSVSHRHQHGRPAHLAAGAQGADAQDAHWDGGARAREWRGVVSDHATARRPLRAPPASRAWRPPPPISPWLPCWPLLPPRRARRRRRAERAARARAPPPGEGGGGGWWGVGGVLLFLVRRSTDHVSPPPPPGLPLPPPSPIKIMPTRRGSATGRPSAGSGSASAGL